MNANRKAGRSAPAPLALALALALAGGITACADGLFAPARPLGPTAALSIATTTAALGGSADAFDRTDAIRVLVTRAAYPVLDTTLDFRPAGEETHIRVPFQLPESSADVTIALELRAGQSRVFEGTANATVKKNETTPVTVPLTPVPAGLQTSPIPTITAIGDTVWAGGAVVFGTGDTIRTLHPTWTSLGSEIITLRSDGMIVARAEGSGQVLVRYLTFVQTLGVTVAATVTSVALSPRDVVMHIGTAPVLFTAVARDRRGNALPRIVTFASRDTSIVRIDSRGLAGYGRLGTTYVVASYGSVSDSTRVTVEPGGPIIIPPAARP